MTLHIPTWLLITLPLLVLAGFPFVYMAVRSPGGDYDLGLDVVLVTVLCWGGTVFLGIGLIVGWLL